MEKQQRWYMRHGAQRTDIFRGAQNVADETGVDQYIYAIEELHHPDMLKGRAPLIIEGVTYFLLDVVKRNPVRAQAGR